MPKIPTFKSEITPNVQRPISVDVGAFSSVSRAEAELGQQVGQTAEQIGSVYQAQQAREKEAERTLKSLEIDRSFQDEVANFTETYQGRQDYDNFEPDMDAELMSLRSKYADQIAGDPVLQIAFERRFNQLSGNLTRVVKAKKLQIMSDRAVGAYATNVNEALQNYASETDPVVRDLIAQDVEIGAHTLVASGFIDQAKAEATIQDFADKSEALRADQMIDIDPYLAEKALAGEEFSTLDPTVRHQKIKQSRIRQKQLADAEKVAVAAEKKRIKDEQKVAHDEEERSIGELFVAGDYNAVVPALMTSKNMTGDELREWTNAAKTAAKETVMPVDKKVRAELRRRINTEPGTVTVTEIWSKLGEGLDDVTAKALTGELAKAIKDPKISVAVKKGQTVLDGFRDAGGFNSGDFAENELRWLEESENLLDWRRDNPDGDIVKYVRDVIIPKEQEVTVKAILRKLPMIDAFGWFADTTPSAPKADYKTRKDMWMEQAKKSNPTFRDRQLSEYYDKKYGGE